jgi:hypothetical protein
VIVGLATLTALAAGACSGDDDAPTVTLPSSLVVPTSVPGTSAPSTTTSTTTTALAPDASPRITGVRARLASATCTGGTVGAEVVVELDPQPPVRAVTMFVDGSASAAASGTPGPTGITLTVPDLPCDGTAHTVLVIATSGPDRSSTEAVSVRTPSGAPSSAPT